MKQKSKTTKKRWIKPEIQVLFVDFNVKGSSTDGYYYS
jgi:hypothetical protein